VLEKESNEKVAIGRVSGVKFLHQLQARNVSDEGTIDIADCPVEPQLFLVKVKIFFGKPS